MSHTSLQEGDTSLQSLISSFKEGGESDGDVNNDSGHVQIDKVENRVSRRKTIETEKYDAEKSANVLGEEKIQRIASLKEDFKARAKSLMTPTCYDEHKLDIRDLIEEFDSYSEAVGFDKEDSYSIFLSFLDTEQRKKLCELEKSEEQKKDWESIRLEIIRVLTPPHQKLEASMRLINVKQDSDESIVQFSKRLKRLVEVSFGELSEVETTESTVKYHLARGSKNKKGS